MEMNPLIRTPIITLALIVILGTAGCFNYATEYRVLIDRNEKISAAVALTDCNNHGRVDYSYEVNGRKYANRTQSQKIRPVRNCAEWKVGDTLLVYYDPMNPEVNSTVLPQDAYTDKYGYYFPEWLWIAVWSVMLIIAPPLNYFIKSGVCQRSCRVISCC